jgi:hypothetical protein
MPKYLLLKHYRGGQRVGNHAPARPTGLVDGVGNPALSARVCVRVRGVSWTSGSRAFKSFADRWMGGDGGRGC